MPRDSLNDLNAKLLAFARKMAAEFHATVFVSREEAELFRGLAPESAAKTTYRIQGVDSEFFDPAGNFANPYPGQAPTLVFTGAMDYWPNVDAVTWFVDEAWSAIRAAVPDAVFCIVGRHPAPEVRKLTERSGVMVTGGVPDVRPYLAHAHAAASGAAVRAAGGQGAVRAWAEARRRDAGPRHLGLDGRSQDAWLPGPDHGLSRGASTGRPAGYSARQTHWPFLPGQGSLYCKQG